MDRRHGSIPDPDGMDGSLPDLSDWLRHYEIILL